MDILVFLSEFMVPLAVILWGLGYCLAGRSLMIF